MREMTQNNSLCQEKEGGRGIARIENCVDAINRGLHKRGQRDSNYC